MTIEIWGIVITLIAASVTTTITLYSWRRLPALSMAMILWFLLALMASQRGFFQNKLAWTASDIWGFLSFGFFISIPLLGFFTAQIRSVALQNFVKQIPISALLGIQVYRIVGIIFLWLFAHQKMPAILGIATGITDFVIGITALPLAWAFTKEPTKVRFLVIAWNVLGICDFLNAIGIVSLSLFGFVQLQPDPVIIGFHPLALISLFQLPLSIMIHILVLQRLK